MKKISFLFLIFTALLPIAADEGTVPSGSPEAQGEAAAAGPVTTEPAAPAVPAKTVEEEHLETIRFGTETEIANLIQTLRNGNASYLDDELINVAMNTRNRNILAGVFGFFGEAEKTGLEERAIRAIRERDEESNETVVAAVDYLGRVRAAGASDFIQELINSGETRFFASAFRALGRIGGSGEDPEKADSLAYYLLDYYQNRNPGDEYRREIITALGETGSGTAVAFLSEIVKNNDERAVLRMAALASLSKIGDAEGLEAVIEAVSSQDPNIRSAAIGALGPFSGEAAERAILEGFRDSFYRTRIGAAQAAGARRLASAIPYLQYRAERDDVPAVKDEAIRALGAINSAESMAILNSLFIERKNSDRVRLLAAEMLMRNDPDNYSSRVIVELDEAKLKNQTPLYNGFVRILTTAKSANLLELARRLIVSGGVIEKSLALDLVLNNEFRGLASEVRSLLDEARYGASIARKARTTLEKLGLEITETSAAGT